MIHINLSTIYIHVHNSLIIDYFSFSFGQVAVLVHLFAIATLWVTTDMGGAYGWSELFKDKSVSLLYI